MNRTCIVCNEQTGSSRPSLLCNRCTRSLDRAQSKDMTIYTVIVWAAKRARAFERARAKEKAVPGKHPMCLSDCPGRGCGGGCQT